MKIVKIILAASLLALASGKISAQVTIGSAEHSVGATDPGDPPGTGESF